MLLGRKAVNVSGNDGKNYVTNVKEFLGRLFEHSHVQNLIKRKTFSVVRAVEDKNTELSELSSADFNWGQILFQIAALRDLTHGLSLIAPTEVAACFFRYLRDEITSSYDTFRDGLIIAVMTVPA